MKRSNYCDEYIIETLKELFTFPMDFCWAMPCESDLPTLVIAKSEEERLDLISAVSKRRFTFTNYNPYKPIFRKESVCNVIFKSIDDSETISAVLPSSAGFRLAQAVGVSKSEWREEASKRPSRRYAWAA